MAYGSDAWPGVPDTRMVHQNEPFSATITGRRSPPSPPVTGIPPDSVTT